MENLVLFVYLITRLDAFNSFIGTIQFFTILGGAALVVAPSFYYLLESEREYSSYSGKDENAIMKNESLQSSIKPYKKIGYWLFGVGIFFSIIGVLMPTKKDAMYIAGTYAAVQVANSDPAKKLGKESMDIVRKFLEKTRLSLDADIAEIKSGETKKEPEKKAPEASTSTEAEEPPVLDAETIKALKQLAAEKAKTVIDDQLKK